MKTKADKLLEAIHNMSPGIQTMMADRLAGVLGHLMALRVFYQSAHWLAKGNSYYGDHLLFGRLYDSIAPEIDQIGEKIASISESFLFDSNLVTQTADILQANEQFQDVFNRAVILEQNLIDLCEALDNNTETSSGLKNLVAAIADNHENNLYLLGQRSK